MNTQPNDKKEANRAAAPEQEGKPEIQLSVSPDGLTAAVRVRTMSEDQKITAEELMVYLKQNGIVHGILEEDIRELCEGGRYSIELPCAQGSAPVDQENGTLEYLFRKEKNLLPKELDDGTVDYRELGIVQNVRKGDVLCRVIPPKPGRDGVDVFGKPIPFRKGALPPLPQGRNTVVSEDGRTLISAVDGCVEYRNMSLSVSEVFIVHGDVGSASGNIDFLGTVVVQGDVREGFSVKAGGDISVRGMVEGATVEAGGDIAIAYGVNSMNRGGLTAGGSVSSQYIENSTVKCGGDVRTGAILNSVVTAGNSIIIRGRKGLLAGGRAQAGRQIYAMTIGSGGARTELTIASKVLDEVVGGRSGDLAKRNEELEAEKKKREALAAQAETIRQFLRHDPRSLQGKMMLKNVNTQKGLSDAKIEALEEKVRLLTEGDGLSLLDFRVVAGKTICAGTKITIGVFSTVLTSDSDSIKFYTDRDHMISAPALPSDRVE